MAPLGSKTRRASIIEFADRARIGESPPSRNTACQAGYGDVTSSVLQKKLGITRKTPPESDVLADFRVAQHGFAHLNAILRDNADAAYFGKNVTAADKDKLLLFWKIEDEYQVLFGDLRAKSVSAEEFKRIKP